METSNSRTIIHAHRGASAYAPENTISAFKLAIDMGADALELDVQLTRDNKVVVIHDLNTDRTSNCKGPVRNYSLEELRAYDFGSWFSPEFENERIPVLEDVIGIVCGTNVMLNIEIKTPPFIFNNACEKAVAEIIKYYSMEDRVIVSSFNHYSLAEIKKLNSNIKTGILYSEVIYKPWNYAKALGADAIHPAYRSIHPGLISSCKESGIMVNAWTVDNPTYMARLMSEGITGIITNKPDVALRAAY